VLKTVEKNEDRIPELITLGHILMDIRAYVDEFPSPDSSVKIKGQIQYSPGGSATNVAVAAAKLGINSAICSILGFDAYGIEVMKQLMNERVDVSNIKINYQKPTGISMVIVNNVGEPIIIQSLGANEPYPMSYLNVQNIQAAKHLHMTGTDPKALEKAAEIAKTSKKNKVTVSFDPGRSISYLGYEKLMAIIKNVDYLIINRKEAASVAELSKETDILEIIDALRSKVPSTTNLVIKGGSKETIVKSSKEFFAVPPFNVKVFDTIGAGDAFGGAFIVGLLQKKSLKDSIIMAHANASYKIQFGGAQSSATTEQIEEFMAAHENEITPRDLD